MAEATQPSGDWAEVLEQIRQALEAALAQTQAREQEASLEQKEAPGSPTLTAAEERIERLRQFAEQALRQQVEQAEPLAGGEERLRRWLADALAARQRLAEWASRRVG